MIAWCCRQSGGGAWRAAVLAGAVVLAEPAALGDVLYVDDDAPPGGDGLSWQMAFVLVQDALDVAADPGNSITEIRVGQGRYLPTKRRNRFLPRSELFELVDGVALRGGYAGYGAPDPDARDVQQYETILDGDLNGDDQPGFVNRGDNAYHVVASWDTGPGTAIEGFTIRGGDAVLGDQQTEWAYGGGLYVYGGSVAISQCHFTENQAVWAGGALSMDNDVLFLVSDCQFTGNLAGVYGGAIYSRLDTVGSFDNCVFADNESLDHGGAVACFSRIEQFMGCQFMGNRCAGNGGAIYGGGDDPLFLRCEFVSNHAEYSGGAVAFVGSDPDFIACVFLDNSAGDLGGALQDGDFRSRIANCHFQGNHSDVSGGAIAMVGVFSGGTIINTTIMDNSAPVAGAIDVRNTAAPYVTHSVLWGNGPEPTRDVYDNIVIRYSCIEGGWNGSGSNNIDEDPLFQGPGNIHLSPGSPCIDAGDPDYQPFGEFDIDGEPRLFACRVDMGADEAPFVGIDCNSNGRTDTCDIDEGFATDCNANGIPDDCDIDSGSSQDLNGNSIPDECEIPQQAIAYEIHFGRHESGGVPELRTSNDQYLRIEQRAAVTPLLPLIRVDIEGLAEAGMQSTYVVTIRVETGVNAIPFQPPQRLSAYKYTNGLWEIWDQRTATLGDSVVVVSNLEEPDSFVDFTNDRLKLRLEWFDPGNVFSPAWGARIDLAEWSVAPRE